MSRLTKIYRGKAAPANDAISLDISRGDFLGVFGPNGAGKTTLVKQLAGLLRPTSGSIWLNGEDVVADPAVVARHVGYYGQKVAALRHHTTREVLTFTGCLRGLARADASRQAASMIERFRLDEHADRRLGRQSGGEQRLAVLLATFIGSPSIVVLDEPTNELDPARRRDFWDFLAEYGRQHDATVILTTHNLAEAENVVERVAMIDRGQLIALDTLGELKRQVDDQVRLELRLRPGSAHTVDEVLTGIEGSRRLRDDRWDIVVRRDQAGDLMPTVVTAVGVESIDDFRLITPTLEDVYLRLTGNEVRRALSR